MSKEGYFQRYMLIIRLIRNNRYISLSELIRKVEDGLAYFDETEDVGVSRRTILRDLNEIRSGMGISIEYSRTENGYYIPEDEDKMSDLERILEQYDLITSLRAREELSSFVFTERRKPRGTEHLSPLIHAIKRSLVVEFTYVKFYNSASKVRSVMPYALKEGRGRWYLLAIEIGENVRHAAARTQQEETAAQEETRQEETGQTETAAAQAMDPQAFEIISRDFSHSGYVDSIAFLLPSGWAYESYERMHAGEGMDPEEWGFEIRMDGKEESVLLVYGSRQEGEGRFDPEEEGSQEVQTGAGLTGQRYIRQTVTGDGEILQEYYVRFDPVAGSGAVYQVYVSLSPEDYEKYRTSLDTLTAGISIAAIARTE